MSDRLAISVLNECADLMRAKGKAYNRIPQAEYYPNGEHDIFVMMWQKVKRIQSLLSEEGDNNFESIDDSCRDLINYTAFMVEFLNGEMDGQ